MVMQNVDSQLRIVFFRKRSKIFKVYFFEIFEPKFISKWADYKMIKWLKAQINYFLKSFANVSSGLRPFWMGRKLWKLLSLWNRHSLLSAQWHMFGPLQRMLGFAAVLPNAWPKMSDERSKNLWRKCDFIGVHWPMWGADHRMQLYAGVQGRRI